MVNVNSRIPFNLHNQNLPPDSWFSASPKLNYNPSLSRSTSHSDLIHNLTYYHPHDFDRGTTRYRHPLHPGNPYSRVSSFPHSPRGSPPDSPDSPEQEASTAYTRPNPILNVRLVGFEDQRGRSRERERDRNPDSNIVGSASTVTQSHIPTMNSNPNSRHDRVRSHYPLSLYVNELILWRRTRRLRATSNFKNRVRSP